MLGERVFEIELDARHFHGRKEFAVGKLRQTFSLAADAGEFFHVVIPRSNVGIANRPIDCDSIFQVGFEIEIAPAIALAAPSNGFSTDLAPANPGKMLSWIGRVGILDVVNEELVRVLVAGVIAFALYMLRAFAFGAIIPAAVLEFPDGNVLDVILLGDDGAAGFEDQRAESFFREFFCGPSTGDSRADNDRVVGIRIRRHEIRLALSLCRYSGTTVVGAGNDFQT